MSGTIRGAAHIAGAFEHPRRTIPDRTTPQIHAEVAPRLPRPDLVLWLQASPATLMQRVRRRGIEMEQDIDDGYLQRLSAAYGEHFMRDAALPVLAIDTESFDPARAQDMERLLARLQRFRGPRETL